jgi:hypothetical protein
MELRCKSEGTKIAEEGRTTHSSSTETSSSLFISAGQRIASIARRRPSLLTSVAQYSLQTEHIQKKVPEGGWGGKGDLHKAEIKWGSHASTPLASEASSGPSAGDDESKIKLIARC